MIVGMLWFDNSKAPLAQKIQKAVDYYVEKYDRTPNLCLVHPSMILPGPDAGEGMPLTVRPYRPVLPGHIWIGIEETTDVANSA